MNDIEIIYIISNLHKSNADIARYLNRTEASVRNYLYKHKIRRDDDQILLIRSKIGEGLKGENNPNWKDGISKDYYHYKKIQVVRYPERVKARQLVYYHKRAGNIQPQKCLVCKSENNLTAHHEDYTKPLDIVWLCRDHHNELHRRYNQHNQFNSHNKKMMEYKYD